MLGTNSFGYSLMSQINIFLLQRQHFCYLCPTKKKNRLQENTIKVPSGQGLWQGDTFLNAFHYYFLLPSVVFAFQSSFEAIHNILQ
jgi:hypothetical protein